MHVLLNIVNVFFGTVRRAQVTLLVLVVFYFYRHPGYFQTILRGILHGVVVPAFHEVVTALIGAVSPMIPSLLVLGLVWYFFKAIFKKATGKK